MAINVLFQGSGPFAIDAAQSASARSLERVVEMTINCIVGDDPHPRPIYVQMTHGVANQLGHDLIKAAIEVETRKT
jgi:hypothetical protein